MQLLLTVLRCPETVAPESRTVSGGEFTVGRGPGVDWVLPDPERLLSKRHFAVAFRGGAWQIADISTNGTFLNRDPQPIGRDQIRDLSDGDRLRLGAYEIEVRLAEGPATAARRTGANQAGPVSARYAGFPLEDPFAPPARTPAPATSRLPDDFDPLAAPAEQPFVGPTQRDDAPALQDAFAPPPPLLPDDWDQDLSIANPPRRGLSPRPSPTGDRRSLPGVARQMPEPSVPEASIRGGVPSRRQQQAAVPAGVSDRSTSDADLLAAFLAGAGLPEMRPADPAAMMEALGAAFRSLVAGLRAVLIARAAIKSEFRIEQTVIRAGGNNPLKFSANDDDALAALLGTGRRADMGPAEAVADALRDVRLHELAAVSAMQTAVRALLDGLSPAKLRAQAEQGGSLLSAQRKARAFEAYEALHARTVQALADDFESVFGKAFARAYERALAEIAGRERS